MADTTPFVINDDGVALLENPVDASLVVGANAKSDGAPGFWSFQAIHDYLKTKLGIADISGLNDALGGKQDAEKKGVALGFAGLDGEGKVPLAQLPIDFANMNKIKLAAFDNSLPADGDLWFDGTDLKFRVAGATKTVTLI